MILLHKSSLAFLSPFVSCLIDQYNREGGYLGAAFIFVLLWACVSVYMFIQFPCVSKK